MSWREDSFELHVPKRSHASADAASTLGSLAESQQSASQQSLFRQGDLVRVPPGKYVPAMPLTG